MQKNRVLLKKLGTSSSSSNFLVTHCCHMTCHSSSSMCCKSASTWPRWSLCLQQSATDFTTEVRERGHSRLSSPRIWVLTLHDHADDWIVSTCGYQSQYQLCGKHCCQYNLGTNENQNRRNWPSLCTQSRILLICCVFLSVYHTCMKTMPDRNPIKKNPERTQYICIQMKGVYLLRVIGNNQRSIIETNEKTKLYNRNSRTGTIVYFDGKTVNPKTANERHLSYPACTRTLFHFRDSDCFPLEHKPPCHPVHRIRVVRVKSQ